MRFLDVVVRDGVIVGEGGGGDIVAVAIGRVGEAEIFERVEGEVFFRRDEG